MTTDNILYYAAMEHITCCGDTVSLDECPFHDLHIMHAHQLASTPVEKHDALLAFQWSNLLRESAINAR